MVPEQTLIRAFDMYDFRIFRVCKLNPSPESRCDIDNYHTIINSSYSLTLCLYLFSISYLMSRADETVQASARAKMTREPRPPRTWPLMSFTMRHMRTWEWKSWPI